MRVLHVIATGKRGGGYTHLHGVLPELAKLGIESAVAVGSDGPLAPTLTARGICVDVLDLPGPRPDPRGVLGVARVIARRTPDLVQYHGTRAGFFGALRRLGGGPPAVYTVHGLSYRCPGLERVAFATAEAIISRAVDQVLSVSAADIADLERRRFLRRGRAIHVPNAVDDRFRPGDAAAARARMGWPATARILGTVGRLAPEKAIGDFLDVVGKLAGVHAVVIGDGPERARLEQRAAPFAERVHFLGWRDDVADILPAFDVFVLTSRWEGEPIVLLEAMAAGVPCVATSIPGTREIIKTSGTGVLVPPGDSAALAAAVRQLLEDGERCRRIADAGRRAVADRTYPQLAARLAEVYAALGGRLKARRWSPPQRMAG